MKNKYYTKNNSMFNSRTFVSAIIVFVLFLFLSVNTPAQKKEDPLNIIKKKGTAGMKLEGGKSILVKDNKIFVKTGKRIRALFSNTPRFRVVKNQTKINSNGLRILSLNAIKTKFSRLYSKSYNIHATFATKFSRGNQRTLSCRLVFEHKNIWYAEEVNLELDIITEGRKNVLKRTRILRKPIQARILKRKTPFRRKLIRKTTAKTAKAGSPFTIAKRRNLKLTMPKATMLADKYSDYRQVPVYRLIKEFHIPVMHLGPGAKGLANTAYPGVVTAKTATDQVHFIMHTALGSADKLIGAAQSSKTKLLNYLRNGANLVAWNNIGHGDNSTLYQNGTSIKDTDITATATFKGIKNCVCLINSCQTFHNPLKTALLNQNPRVFIAGVLNLPMVTSEGSNPNFWFKTLILKKPMSVAYSETNTASGLNGYWGYWGYTGKF